jgi:PAS domain-containing protein
LPADDLGDPGALRSLEGRIAAFEAALRALPAGGFGTINPRGAIDRADASLAALSGVASAQLVGARLGSLFDIATRASINDLIERALGDGESGSTTAAMLTRGGNPRSVSIGIAPRRERQGIGGASFVIVALDGEGGA